MNNAARYYHVFAGSYSSADQEGIEWLRFDAQSGSLTRMGGTSGTVNPSFLAVDLDRNLLFAVSETNEGEVVSYRIERETHTLTEIGRQPSYGVHPCHLSLDPSGDWLMLVNYSSGDICVYPVSSDGSIRSVSHRIRHEGSSVRKDRQKSEHPHSIFPIPSTDYYLVSDLGTDEVYTYRLDKKEGKLNPVAKTKVIPGSGPRHLAFHPSKPIVYLIEELSSTITAFTLNSADHTLSPFQTISTLPDEFKGESTCAEIVVSERGDYVYGSNRGHDSIASFRIDEEGRLVKLGHTPSGGRTPRNFVLVPGCGYMLAANQNADNIVVMKLNEQGVPEHTGETYVMEKPVCLKIISEKG